MTATINTSRPRERGRPRTLRFSSMECLGFSDAASTWSDSPVPFAMTVATPSTRTGRHVAPPPEPDPIAAWQPAEFGDRLAGSNIRWGVIVALVVLVATTGGFGYWLSQRAAANAAANSIAVEASATALDDALPGLEAFNSGLVDSRETIDTVGLNTVDGAARDLFTASGAVPDSERADAIRSRRGDRSRSRRRPPGRRRPCLSIRGVPDSGGAGAGDRLGAHRARPGGT